MAAEDHLTAAHRTMAANRLRDDVPPAAYDAAYATAEAACVRTGRRQRNHPAPGQAGHVRRIAGDPAASAFGLAPTVPVGRSAGPVSVRVRPGKPVRVVSGAAHDRAAVRSSMQPVNG